jgi:hypothetical protein
MLLRTNINNRSNSLSDTSATFVSKARRLCGALKGASFVGLGLTANGDKHNSLLNNNNPKFQTKGRMLLAEKHPIF